MPIPLTQLVRRLAAPPVAAHLAKEELCLALAAIGQLRPLLQTGGDEAGASSPFTEPLTHRILRILPRCTPQEVRMVALGARALPWQVSSSSLVADALVHTLYKQTLRSNLSSTPQRATSAPQVRWIDIVAVVQQALEAHHYFNYTLLFLASEYLLGLAEACPVISAPAAEEFVAVVCGYMGVEEGLVVVQRLAASLEAASSAPAENVGLGVLKKYSPGQPLTFTERWASPFSRWTQKRRELLEAIHNSDYTGDEVFGIPLQLHKARHDVWQVVRKLQTATTAVSDEQLLHALEVGRVFRVCDPVALTTLDEVVSARVRSPELPAAALTAYEGSIYAQVERFPQTLGALRQRDAVTASGLATPPEALQRVSPVQRIYENAVAGVAVTEKDLFSLSTDVKTFKADELAKSALVFARVKAVPPSLVLLITNLRTPFTLDGVVALVRASRYDRYGALRTVLDSCLGSVKQMQACLATATIASLVELLNALALPRSRWVSANEKAKAIDQQLIEGAITQLMSQVEQIPATSLFSVISLGGGGLPDTSALVQASCDRLLDYLLGTEPQPTLTRCLDILESLQRGCVTHERLLDFLADTFAFHFASLSQAPSNGDKATADPQQLAALLRFTLLQLQYGSPEMAEVGTNVVQKVRRGLWDAQAPPVLVAAALFSMDSSTTLFSSAALELPYNLLAHLAEAKRLKDSMTIDLAVAVVELLSMLPLANSHHVLSLVTCVLPLTASLPPPVAAKLLTVYHRHSSAPETDVPPELYNRVAINVLSLPPATLTALCKLVSHSAFDTALANSLTDALPLVADTLSAHQLSQCVFGLGEMTDAGQRLSHQVMTEALSDYAVDNVEMFTSGRDIASLLHGFAKLQCTKRNLYSVFVQQLSRRCVVATLDFRSISFLFYAFGAAKFVDEKLMHRLATVFVRHSEELTVPDLLLSLRGFSRMHLLNNVFYRKLGDRVVAHADEFPLQAQCELLHAYGALEERHSALVEALGKRIAASAESLPSVSVATDVLVSMWLMGSFLPSLEHANELVKFVVRRAAELTGPDMVKLCTITLDQKWEQPELLCSIAARAVEMNAKQSLDATTARMVLDTLGAGLIFNPTARRELSTLARSASKEVVMLSGDEQEQLNLITSH